LSCEHGSTTVGTHLQSNSLNYETILLFTYN